MQDRIILWKTTSNTVLRVLGCIIDFGRDKQPSKSYTTYRAELSLTCNLLVWCAFCVWTSEWEFEFDSLVNCMKKPTRLDYVRRRRECLWLSTSVPKSMLPLDDKSPSLILLDIHTFAVEENVLDSITEQPGTNTFKLSRTVTRFECFAWDNIENPPRTTALPLSYAANTDRKCWRLPIRLQFCRWFLRQYSNLYFHSRVLFKVKTKFSRDSIMNNHNEHLRADANSFAMIASRHQHTFYNVWVGIVGDHLLIPKFLPDTSRRYMQTVFGARDGGPPLRYSTSYST